LETDEAVLDRDDAQHSESRWMAEADLISASNVHENTKAYFRKAISRVSAVKG